MAYCPYSMEKQILSNDKHNLRSNDFFFRVNDFKKYKSKITKLCFPDGGAYFSAKRPFLPLFAVSSGCYPRIKFSIVPIFERRTLLNLLD